MNIMVLDFYNVLYFIYIIFCVCVFCLVSMDIKPVNKDWIEMKITGIKCISAVNINLPYLVMNFFFRIQKIGLQFLLVSLQLTKADKVWICEVWESFEVSVY